MFRRSSRVSTKPQTVQMQQEKNAANTEARKALAKRKVMPKEKIRLLKGIQKTKPDKKPVKKPVKKQRVILFNVLNSQNNNTKVFNMLYSIYKSTSDPKLNKTISYLNSETIKIFIKKQYVILNNNVRSNGNKNELNLKLSETDKLDFCLLIWLDMRHDAKTKKGDSMKGVSFKKFLNSDLLKMIIRNPPSFQMTVLMKKMIELNIISKDLESPGPKDWERKIKDNLPELFGIKKPNKVSSQRRLPLDIRNPINISIDSEGSKSAISMLIANNKTQKGDTIYYPIRSFITIANRVDPGNTMPTGGLQQEWAKMFPNASNNSRNPDALDNSGNLKSTQIYNVSDCEFKIGDTKLELTSGTKGTFNMTVNGKSIKVGSTAKSVGPNNNNNKTPLLTENQIKNRNRQKDEARVSKFLGDFMQILTVCSEPQRGKVTALGTVDGVASGIYTFISKRLMNRDPYLFIDMYIEQGNYINVYGFSRLLNTNRNNTPTQSVIYTYKSNNKGNNNMENTAGSNSNRTISVNSASNGNRTINRNKTITGNSESNSTGSIKQKNTVRKPNGNGNVSIIGNSGSNRNNNNEITSKPQNPKRPITNVINNINKNKSNNLGTRITTPQNPVFKFKRKRSNNGTNGRRVTRSRTPAK